MITEPESVPRQPLLAIPGWLLFACLALPTLSVCGDPMVPLQFPPSYAVYLGGLVIALIGGARLVRSRRHAFSVLLGLWTLTLFAIVTVSAGAATLAAGLLFGGVFLWVQTKLMLAMFRTAWGETAIAVGCLSHAVIATGWSALMAFDRDGLWGAHVALWSGLALCVASAIMLSRARAEVRRKRRESEPAALPEARAIVRH